MEPGLIEMRRELLVCVGISLLVMAGAGTVGLYAQEATSSEPGWVLYQKGLAQLREREFGQALRLFREAIGKDAPYPEATAGLGMVYEAESSLDLAVRRYKEALEAGKFFRIPESRIEIMYSLARVYEKQGRLKEYSDTLESIASEQPEYTEQKFDTLRSGMRRTILTDGLNRLVTLYRLEGETSLQANSLLGIQYVRTGNYTPALENMTFACLKILSTLVREIRREEPEYQFQDARTLFADAFSRDTLRAYVGETNLFENLYYLAAAVYGEDPESTTWREIWTLVRDSPESGAWASRAASRLASPRLEPLIEH